MSQPISLPPPPCEDDVEREMLFNHQRNMLDDSIAADNVERKSTPFLILLTIGMGGVQIVFSVIYSHGLSHLQYLGLDKSQTAIAFLAGPLSGMIVQPCIGIWSDHSKSRWGRRRPFIAIGAVALIASLLGLAWTTSIVNMLFESRLESILYYDDIQSANAVLGIILTFSVYISIQPVQGGIRALIAEAVPGDQQQEANAWVSRISGCASVLGYLSAYLDLGQYMSLFGDTQFKNLSVLASMSLALSVGLTCAYVKERRWTESIDSRLNDEKLDCGPRYSSVSPVSEFFQGLAAMPRPISYILVVQFFAWMGWFPYLMYVSTYVGDIYMTSVKSSRSTTAELYRSNWETSTRVGSLALLIFASVTVLTACLLPVLISLSHVDSSGGEYKRAARCYLKRVWSSRFIEHRVWMMAHVLFAICMFATFFVSSTEGTLIICGFAGISWAISNWIPCALLGRSISEDLADSRPFFSAGTIFGLNNVAICVPQIIVSVGSSIFWKLDKDTPTDPESIAWVLRIGGFSALAAAWFTQAVERSEAHTKDDIKNAGQGLDRTSSEVTLVPMVTV